eukprot:COSAG02_NODE_2677_length_8267_cov_29.491797_2_plen_730_part_00
MVGVGQAELPGQPAAEGSGGWDGRNGLQGKRLAMGALQSQSAPNLSAKPGQSGLLRPRLATAVSATRYTVRANKEAQENLRKQQVWLSPDSAFRHSWDAFMSGVLLIIGTVLPFRVGFQVEIELRSWIGVASVLVDLLFVVDIILNMNTGFTKPDGQVEMRTKEARMHYIRHWFLVDLLASLPVRYVGWILKERADGQADGGDFSKVVKVLRLLRLAHLLRLSKFKKQWEQHKEEFHALQRAGKLTACVFGMLYACHLIACMWFYVGTMGMDGPQGAPGGWIEAEWPEHTHGPNGTFDKVPNLERYITSMYWAITVLSTVGFGEIHPHTNAEKVFSLFAELIGCFIFMMLVGNLSAIMTDKSAIDQKVSNSVAEVREFLLDKQVEGKVRQKTLGALEHTFRAKVHDEKHEMISHLPKAMQETVHSYLYSTFDNLKIFERFHDTALSRANREAIGELCGKMRPLVITPTDNGSPATIYEVGDSAGEIYFIIKGVVHITTILHENEKAAALDLHSKAYTKLHAALELTEGDHFGERELFFRHAAESEALLEMNVMANLGPSNTGKRSKPAMADLPLAQRKRHQDALVTPQWAGNASLFFLRWDDVMSLRESKSVASRTVFTMLQSSAAERVQDEGPSGHRHTSPKPIWTSREDTIHYPFARTIQRFYRRHRKESYNYTLESALKGLDPSMEAVMRAMLGRMDALEAKVSDVAARLDIGEQEDANPPAWGGP